jgi:cation diffusion facilitator family transporter
MAMKSGPTVLVALGANAAVAAAKITAGLIGGSAVMWAEAGHSVADTLNQTFLYASLRRADREADRQHPFGYGKERFFWALIAAVGVFVAGAGFSLFEAFKSFTEKPQRNTTEFLINYAVFGAAAILEGISWIRAYRQTRQEANRLGRSVARHIKLSPDPNVKTVVSEDTVAVAGNLLGIGGTALQQITDQPLWDGVAALMIMAMLVFVAFALARDNKDLLIGEAIEPEQERKITAILEGDDRIKKVLDLMTMRLGTESVLLAARVDFVDDLSGEELQQATSEVEDNLRESFPGIKRIFLDPASA